MNRIILIGNGFDLAHGLKTSYSDFFNWYVKDFICQLKNVYKYEYNDSLLKVVKREPYKSINTNINHFPLDYFLKNQEIYDIKSLEDTFNSSSSIWFLHKSELFKRISKSVETKGWVDIENVYYQLLKDFTIKNPNFTPEDKECIESVAALNIQMSYLRNKLAEYLEEVQQDNKNLLPKDGIKNAIYEPVKTQDITQGNINVLGRTNSVPKCVLFLNFNYTNTTNLYLDKNRSLQIHIHGDLQNPNGMIFGYGDDKDEDYYKLENLNYNECLSNVKSIRYLESDNYRIMRGFLELSPYQVCIMGHSCGNSDRTLLKTIFEHKNCVSIKPYYYKKKDNSDNFIELAINISRNFSDKTLLRDRVVNKKYCKAFSSDVQK